MEETSQIHHKPPGDGWSLVGEAGLGGPSGSLELAEDVSIFCRDAGGLQDCHTESEDAAQLQVVQGHLQWPVWSRLLWAVQKILWGHCREEEETFSKAGCLPLSVRNI